MPQSFGVFDPMYHVQSLYGPSKDCVFVVEPGLSRQDKVVSSIFIMQVSDSTYRLHCCDEEL